MKQPDLKALDPHARQLLALARKAGHPPLQALTPEKARAAYAASWEPMQSPGVWSRRFKTSPLTDPAVHWR